MDSTSVAPKRLYPAIESYSTGWLQVSDVHRIYYEESGNPDGQPAVVLHGGPGSGTNPRDRQFFDPDKYRIILLDQRGAGKSTPATEPSTTWELVADLEMLRKQLDITAWVVFGGSWGGALALIYAIKHPTSVKALIVFGPVLGTKSEMAWTYSKTGAANVFPDAWDQLVKELSQEEQEPTVIDAYHRRIMAAEGEEKARLCRMWNTWELTIISLQPDPYLVAKADRQPLYNLQHAILECHYLKNNYFFPHNDWLVDNLSSIGNIPTTLVHGRYDMSISARNSWIIHQKMPKSELVIVPLAGHINQNPHMESALVEATDKYRHI